jgi:hypothetical protein
MLMMYEYFIRWEDNHVESGMGKDFMTVLDTLEKLQAHRESDVVFVSIVANPNLGMGT